MIACEANRYLGHWYSKVKSHEQTTLSPCACSPLGDSNGVVVCDIKAPHQESGRDLGPAHPSFEARCEVHL